MILESVPVSLLGAGMVSVGGENGFPLLRRSKYDAQSTIMSKLRL